MSSDEAQQIYEQAHQFLREGATLLRDHEPEVEAGSAIDLDDQAVKPLSVSVFAGLRAQVVGKHYEALLSIQPRKIELPEMIATFTIVRAILESSSQLLYVLGPDDRNDRVWRELNLMKRDMRYADQVAEFYGQPPQLPFIEENAVLICGNLGMDIPTGRIKYGELVEEAARLRGQSDPKEMLTLWNMASGISHGQLSLMPAVSRLTMADALRAAVAHSSAALILYSGRCTAPPKP
jgi:hypothetical protein